MNSSSAGAFNIDFEAFNLFDAPNLTGTPERRLLLAIVERALLDYVGNDARETEEAEEWIFDEGSESTASEFTFDWICNELDLNRTNIREKIKEMPRRGNSRIAPWYLTKTLQTKNLSEQQATRKVAKRPNGLEALEREKPSQDSNAKRHTILRSVKR